MYLYIYILRTNILPNLLTLLQIPSGPEFRSHAILKGIIKEKKIHVWYSLWHMTSVNVL